MVEKEILNLSGEGRDPSWGGIRIMMDPTLKAISDYGVSLTFGQLTPEVVHEVKRRIIDTLGCGMGAYFMEAPRIARAYPLEVNACPGATILGTRQLTTPDLAAFANGVLIRYLDFNDTSISKMTGHPSNNIAAVLAAAEYAGADIQTAIVGIVLAYEVQDSLGEACQIMENGWDHVSYMAVSSAAGAGKALGLDRKQMANALALAATSNVALLQTRVGELSMWKGCASGNANRNGVFAALMARRGMEGPLEAFEGKKGFFRQLSKIAELRTFGEKRQTFRIQEDKFKSFPCDYEAQCAVHPAIELNQVLGGQVEEIEKVEVETYHRALSIAADTPDKWNPTTRETADHSIPYVVAVALARGSLWLEDFDEEHIQDPGIHRLMQKIEVKSTDEFTRIYPKASPVRIRVRIRSGQEYVREIHYPRGNPKNPMTDQEIEDKFRKLTVSVFSASQMGIILDHLWHLEETKSVGKILSLFAVREPGISAEGNA
jgi:2-methylcitrate dehydratase